MKLLPQTKLNPKGFTLVELLVVIVILAILGVVGVTLFTGTQSQARDAKRKEDILLMIRCLFTSRNQYIHVSFLLTDLKP